MNATTASAWAAELLGKRLFVWQQRLFAEHLLAGDLPDAVDVPTGLGKTGVIALWLAAFAAGANLPRRLIYVVDRRAVVDQATAEADRLADLLGDGDGSNEVVSMIRAGLGLEAGQRLVVSTLRGEHVDNRLWLANPSQPAIVVGTVDMIGSRLLFSGYGVSRGMRPIHAALLGVDALIVLDEAHLVPPFEALVRALVALRRNEPTELPALHVMALSATGRKAAGRAFRMNDADTADPTARARLRAAKRVFVDEPVQTKVAAQSIADRAWQMAHGEAAVVVFVNRRVHAQSIYDLLRKRAKAEDVGMDIALLVGERRVYEREALAKSQEFSRFLPERHSKPAASQTPAFLIATSAGEVGVDLDADHMVCDLVEWERMVQRFGRINRRPAPAPDARIDVIPVLEEKAHDDELPGERIDRLRAPFVYQGWQRDTDGRRDARPSSLLELRDDETFRDTSKRAETPEPLRPELTLALVDAWAMTSLKEHAGRPDVDPWLRGWIPDDPQTHLVWRRLFPLSGGQTLAGTAKQVRGDLSAFFEAAPPRTVETLEAVSYHAAEVLKRRAEAWLERSESVPGRHPPLFVLLESDGSFDTYLTVEQVVNEKTDWLVRVLSNRTVVVDARLGGLTNGLLDSGADDEPLTLDRAGGAWEHLAETVGYRVVESSLHESQERAWRIDYRWRAPSESDDAPTTELRVEVWRGGQTVDGDPAIARRSQSLDEHHRWIEQEVARLVAGLRVSSEIGQAMRFAAAHHDTGKDCEIWRHAMGVPVNAPPCAKSDGRANPRLLAVGGTTYRHEFASTRILQHNAALASLDEGLRDLALHWVASHHGHARPVIAPVDLEVPPSLSVALAREIALRFYRLHRRWGAWGLAWWEAVFRAADWRASARVTDAEESA